MSRYASLGRFEVCRPFRLATIRGCLATWLLDLRKMHPHTNPSTIAKRFPPYRKGRSHWLGLGPQEAECRRSSLRVLSESRRLRMHRRSRQNYSQSQLPHPHGNSLPSNPPRAAFSHSDSVGKRYPLASQSTSEAERLSFPIRYTAFVVRFRST